MAKTYFPFNSVIVDSKPDRAANAETLARYLTTFFKDGVVLDSSTALQVYAKTGMTIEIRPGTIFMDGRILYSNANESITLDASSSLMHRIDRIVVRLDLVNRILDFAVVKGEESSTPTAPALTRSGDIYEMCLAEVAVNATTTEITQAMITDTRANTDLCGVAAAAIQQIDTSTFYEQYTAQFEALYADADEDLQAQLTQFQNDFDTWFENCQNIVDSATLAGVKAEIAELDAEVLSFSNVSVSASAFTADTTYTNYPYKAEIPLTGVTANYSPSTRYSVDTKDLGIEMIEDCGADTLIIYAAEAPASDFVIPAVICTKVVA